MCYQEGKCLFGVKESVIHRLFSRLAPSNENSVKKISIQKLYLINIDKNQISSSQRRIQQPCHTSLKQKLMVSKYFY